MATAHRPKLWSPPEPRWSMSIRGPGYKSRSGQTVYFHVAKTRLSTLGTGDVPRGSDSTYNSRARLSQSWEDIKKRPGRLGGCKRLLPC